MIIEKVTAIPSETDLELMGRARHTIGTRQLFASCNPDGPGHHFYEWFVDPATRKKGFRFVQSNYESNPYLPPDYIRALFDTYPESIVERYLLGQWLGVDGLVYSNFDHAAHVIDRLPPSRLLERTGTTDSSGGRDTVTPKNAQHIERAECTPLAALESS